MNKENWKKKEARYGTLIMKWREQREQGHLTQIQELSWQKTREPTGKSFFEALK